MIPHSSIHNLWWCYSPSFACLVFSTCSPHMWVVLGSSYPGGKIPWINNTDTVQRWSIFLLWLMCKLRAILIEKNKYVYRCFFSLTCWLLRSFICIYIFTCICSDVSLYLDLLVHEALHLHFYLYLYLYFFRYVILPWLACSWGFAQECLINCVYM